MSEYRLYEIRWGRMIDLASTPNRTTLVPGENVEKARSYFLEKYSKPKDEFGQIFITNIRELKIEGFTINLEKITE